MATFRPVTDGAGQEIQANLDAIAKTLEGESASAASSNDYTSKQLLTESTGRQIASQLSSIMTALLSYIAPSAKKVENKLTIGSSSYDGSAAVTISEATQSAAGLLSAEDKKKIDTLSTSQVTGVKGNSETSYRTGDVNITAANILGSSAIGSSTKPVYYSGSALTAFSTTVGGSAKPVYISSGTITACSSTVGSGTKPVYMSSGTITVSSSSVGGTAQPVYMTSGEITACSDTVGGTAKPVYMNAGTITACSSTVGSASKPVYMSSGTITACSSTVGSASKPVYMSSGTITACSSTVGGTARPVYMSSGTITACSSTVGDTNTPVYMSSGTITAGTPNNLEDMSWTQISTLSKAGKAASIFHVGQEKKITLSTGEEVTAVILGFNHDTLSDGSGKAGITFGLKNCLKTTYAMNSSATNSGGWSSSAMRTRMSTFKGYLPSDLQNVLQTVNKKTSAGAQSSTINTTEDELFLFSQIEVFGTYYYNQASSPSQYSYFGEGHQYDYFKGKTWCSYYVKYTIDTFETARTYTANLYYQENGYKGLGDDATSASSWWLRSPYYGNSTGFCLVNYYGYCSYSSASSSFGVCFGFCV